MLIRTSNVKAPMQRFVAGAFVCVAFLCGTVRPQQAETLNNATVIELVAAGIGDAVLIPKIRSSRVIIDASEPALLKLKSAGVSDAVIVAMLERAAVDGYISNGGDLERLELPSGSEVKIVTTEKISGKKVTEGQKLTLKTAEDVTVAGKIVIRKDTPVAAVVTRAKKPGMAGRGGSLSLVLESTTTADGQMIKLRAAKSGQGGDNFGTAFTLSYFMGIGLLIPGKNAQIKAGTVFTAYTNERKFISPAGPM